MPGPQYWPNRPSCPARRGHAMPRACTAFAMWVSSLFQAQARPRRSDQQEGSAIYPPSMSNARILLSLESPESPEFPESRISNGTPGGKPRALMVRALFLPPKEGVGWASLRYSSRIWTNDCRLGGPGSPAQVRTGPPTSPHCRKIQHTALNSE